VTVGGIRTAIVNIAIDEVEVHRKVRIFDLGFPVLGRGQPTACAGSVSPRVKDNLVPPCRKSIATIVVVAEDTQPRNAIKAWAPVNTFEDVSPLTREISHNRRGLATLDVNPAPIKIVSDIDDVVRSI